MSVSDNAKHAGERPDHSLNTQSRVIIYTSNHTIRGTIALFAGARLTDFMNMGGEFVAITHAHVATPDGQTVLRSRFLNLRRDQIVLIVEESALISDRGNDLATNG